MDKIAAYEMILEDHPLWTKVAGEARRARIVQSIMNKASRGAEIPKGLERAFNTASAKNQRNTNRVLATVGMPRVTEEVGKVVKPGDLDDYARTVSPTASPFKQVVQAGRSKDKDTINRINQVSARGFFRNGR
jgi:hypothetical protein